MTDRAVLARSPLFALCAANGYRERLYICPFVVIMLHRMAGGGGGTATLLSFRHAAVEHACVGSMETWKS